MDDISKRRLQGAIAEGTERLGDAITVMKEGIAPDALYFELGALGVPPTADLAHAWHLIGFVIGNMASHHCSAADCQSVLDAISGLTYGDAYDICTHEGVADSLDQIADELEIDHERVYRWGRFMRTGMCEVVFGLEDHFSIIGEHPGTADLQERALAAITLMITTLHPAFFQARAQ